jgi:hypothetical protein
MGASAQTRPYPPPVMAGLYDRLAKEFPDEWGPLSRLGNHAAEFRADFEGAFTEFALRAPETRLGISRRAIDSLEDLRTPAIYFCQFNFDPDGSDCYSKLILALKNFGSLSSCIFGSLNYDCLFEQAASILGHRIDYSCVSTRADEIRVAKIHGSCNFVMPVTQTDRAQLASPNFGYEKEFDIIRPECLETCLQEALSSQTRPWLPVMSQISPGKENSLAPVKIQEYRNRWQEQVRAAEAMAIIGVSHNRNDTHILDTVRGRSVPIYYIGGCRDATNWKTENPRVTHVDQYFEPGLVKLLAALK